MPSVEPGWVATPPSPASLYPTQANDVTTSFYDADGDEVQSTNPDVETTLTAYDPDGRTYCTVDPTNVADGVTCPADGVPHVAGTSTTTYDPDGRTTSTVDQVGDITNFTYDPDGNKLTSSNPGVTGDTTSYCYYWQTSGCAASAPTGGGADNMLYSTTTPAGETTTTTYWPGGSSDVVLTPAGTTTTTPDDVGDTLSVTYVKSGSYTQPPSVTYTYNPDQSRAKMVDGTGTTTYGYDDAGELFSKDLAAKSGTHLANQNLGYTYFPSGQTETITYPSYGTTTNPQATYGYDAAGEMTSVTDWADNTIDFAYDQDGTRPPRTTRCQEPTPGKPARCS